jgi:tetratricopeptide (TPR) repeat protein
VAALAGTGAGRRALAKLEQIRRGNFAAAATQRDIGFLAAAEMTRVRPLLGVGPGAFSNAFVPARIAAEERAARRFRHGSGSAHFENAHSEPVTLAAECGLPAAALAVVAAAATLLALARRREDTLFALLLALGVLSLASFPLRLAVSCGPAAFVLGLAWRRPARTETESPVFEDRKRWRPWAVAAGAGVIAILGTVRAAAVWNQAEGENRLRMAALLTGLERSDLIVESRTFLRRALSLRPRAATAWLALGSTYRLEQDFRNAREAYARSLSFEERAETDLNMGVCLLRLSSPEAARPFFVRAVWILPRLADSLPPDVDVTTIQDEVARAGDGLKNGGQAPALPVSFRSPL